MNKSFLNPLTYHPSINVINVPPTFWRKKFVNKYNSIIYDDVDEDLYIFKSYDKSMKRSPHYTSRPRSDLILWDKSVDEPEILRGLHIGRMSMPPSATILSISSTIIEIPSVREESRDQCLTSNFVSTRAIHRPFVVDNQVTTSMRVK